MRLCTIPDAARELGGAVAEHTIRDQRYHAQPRLSARGETIPPNGFGDAFVKVGRKVLVDMDRYLEKIEAGRGR